jgi:hypothetical protein
MGIFDSGFAAEASAPPHESESGRASDDPCLIGGHPGLIGVKASDTVSTQLDVPTIVTRGC